MNAPSPARMPIAAASPIVLREDIDEIAVLTLNRPEARNSLSEAMLAALGEQFAAIGTDRSVRVVVVAANGPAFCAGHDLKELTARRGDPDKGRAFFSHVMQMCSALALRVVRLKNARPLRSEEHTSELQSLRHLVCRLLLAK